MTRQQLVVYELTGSDISIDVAGKTFFDYKPRRFSWLIIKTGENHAFLLNKLVSDTLPCG